MKTIEERVADGAAWLDANVPDWAERIDLDKLAIADPCGCILGQLYGDYGSSPLEARYTGDEYRPGSWIAPARGFDSATVADDNALTVEWRRLIEARRNQ